MAGQLPIAIISLIIAPNFKKHYFRTLSSKITDKQKPEKNQNHL